MHEDLRYGLTFSQVIREMDSPFFLRPKPVEQPPINPNDQIFYEQFLNDYFREEREIGILVDGAGQLHTGFKNWKKRALFSVEPMRHTLQPASELYQIYDRMSLSGLFQMVSAEVDRSINDPDYCNPLISKIEWILFEGVVSGALELDEELRTQEALSGLQVQIVFPPPDSGNAFFHGY